MKVKAYAAYKPKEELKPFEYNLEAPQPYEVQIKVRYCGICHSDLHLIDNDWESDEWPIVPGHEIIGEVVTIGQEVTKHKVGDIVGVGWQSDADETCSDCLEGFQNLCINMKSTCVDRYGGYGEYVNINENYAFDIPQNLNLESAAPLLCAGATVYNPLEYYNVTSGMKVGVIGLGGLGHLAVQFAHKLSCDVTVFSTNPNKEKDSEELGADHFVTDVNNPGLDGTLDFILNTASANLDWNRYLKMLRSRGKLCLVGAVNGDICFDYFNLMPQQKEIVAGSIGSPKTIKNLLNFAVENQIAPIVEIFNIKDINKALDKLRSADVKYRIVLDLQNI